MKQASIDTALSVLFDYIHREDYSKHMVDFELAHGCIDLNCLQFLSKVMEINLENYKKQRNYAKRYILSSSLHKLIKSIDINEHDKENVIATISLVLRRFQELKGHHQPLVYLSGFFSIRKNSVLFSSFIACTTITLLDVNGFTLYWYDYVFSLFITLSSSQILHDYSLSKTKSNTHQKNYIHGDLIVSALESASVFPKISSSHLKSITSSLDFHYDHSRTC